MSLGGNWYESNSFFSSLNTLTKNYDLLWTVCVEFDSTQTVSSLIYTYSMYMEFGLYTDCVCVCVCVCVDLSYNCVQIVHTWSLIFYLTGRWNSAVSCFCFSYRSQRYCNHQTQPTNLWAECGNGRWGAIEVFANVDSLSGSCHGDGHLVFVVMGTTLLLHSWSDNTWS